MLSGNQQWNAKVQAPVLFEPQYVLCTLVWREQRQLNHMQVAGQRSHTNKNMILQEQIIILIKIICVPHTFRWAYPPETWPICVLQWTFYSAVFESPDQVLQSSSENIRGFAVMCIFSVRPAYKQPHFMQRGEGSEILFLYCRFYHDNYIVY